MFRAWVTQKTDDVAILSLNAAIALHTSAPANRSPGRFEEQRQVVGVLEQDQVRYRSLRQQRQPPPAHPTFGPLRPVAISITAAPQAIEAASSRR